MTVPKAPPEELSVAVRKNAILLASFREKTHMPHNPYAPPVAQVGGVEEKTEFDFSGTAPYSFTPRQLWWAGIGCVLTVVLTIPYFILVAMAESMPGLKFALAASIFAMTAISIYIYIIFKKILNEKSSYRGANLAITLYILFSIVSAITSMVTHGASNTLPVIVLSVAELLIFGGVAIYLGIKLLHCTDPLFGQIKPIAYLTLAMGITFASVVLMLLGVLVSFAFYIVMAIMFFRASKALTKAQA